jgi:asparagine synthase (glutamine-hydrolysing)
MCGIAGVVTRAPLPAPALTAMSDAIAHRGPDGVGIWQGDEAALVHRRLSILDIELGTQPMLSDDGQVVVVFNGEIYNYPELRKELTAHGVQLRTHSDTEVLPILYRLHGAAMVQRLTGMFAFAIWDRREHVLLLARDRIGLKPLYYAFNERGLAFASEAKALLASGFVDAELNLDGLWHHASLRFCPGATTLFQGIRKLEPASTLVYRLGSEPAIERYWNLDYTRKSALSFDDAVGSLEGLLRTAVTEHLLSDVPVGSFLSGGIDSGLVTTLAARHVGDGFPTFSIGVGESDFTELPAAKTVADGIRSDHHEYRVQADLMLLLPEIVWFLEEPGDPHAIGIYLLSQLARQHVKVVLSGDGGDEAFAGYARYTRSPVIDAYGMIPRPVRSLLFRSVLARLPDSYSYYSLASKARWAHELSMNEGSDRHYSAFTFFRFSQSQRDQLFTPDARGEVAEPRTSHWFATHFNSRWVDDDVDRMLYTEQMVRLPEHDLRIGDRMSMAHGLEMRPPLVDHRVLEFAASLPSQFKIRKGKLKIILREVAKRYLPQEITKRRKYGFGFPMARWFQGPLAPFITRVVQEGRIFESGFLDRRYAERLLREHIHLRVDHNFRLWSLLNMEVWFRLFLCGESREQVRDWLQSLLHRGERLAS